MYESETEAAAELSWLLGDPTRLTLLRVLLLGKAPVTTLVAATKGTQSNVSNHLRLMREAGLVRANREGRQVLYEIATFEIADLVGTLYSAAGSRVVVSQPAPPLDGSLAAARTCYDHLAGRLGVRLMTQLIASGAIQATSSDWENFEPGPQADTVFDRLGLKLDGEVFSGSKRRFAYGCPDWSENGCYHVGGALGALICRRCIVEEWIKPEVGTRAVLITDRGAKSLEWFIGNRDGVS